MRSLLKPGALLVLSLAACHATRAPATPTTRPPAPAATPSPADDETRVSAASIDRYVRGFGRTWGEAYAFSGYVAVARAGQVIFSQAYGKADRDRGAVAGPDTLFRIGSTTKAFTAIAVLQLEERGLLHLDDPVRKYLPDLPAFADAVTIHHCLTHTSGLPPLPDDDGLVAETGGPHDVTEAFAHYKDRALMFAPGARFQYSNAGFTILGAIVERLSGQSYEAYMREHVFGPAGMVRTTTVSRPSTPTDTAVGYELDPSVGLTAARPITYVTFGCGAILSTANDLLAFDRALSGTGLLRESSKRRMLTPERDVGGIVPFASRYGLGWLITRDGGHDVFYHPGGVNGFEASFARVPDGHVAIVVLSNRFGNTDRVLKITRAAEQAALTGSAPLPVEEPVVSVAHAKALVGEYAADVASRATLAHAFTPDVVEGRAGLSVVEEGGHFFIAWVDRPRAEIYETPEGTRLTKEGLTMTCEAPAGGAAALVLAPSQPGDGLTLRYERLGTSIQTPPGGTCPDGMVRLPGGELSGERREAVAPFCLDVTQVTVSAYARCVRSGQCRPAPTAVRFDGLTAELAAKWSPKCNGARDDRRDHPVNCVDWEQASTYCRAQGKRLPSEQEWDWAALGGQQRRLYPWGYRAPRAQLCWSGVEPRGSTCAVGAFPDGDGLGGVHDLAGNVAEWTSTTGPEGRVLKGSGWNAVDPVSARGATREVVASTFRAPIAGFRCAR